VVHLFPKDGKHQQKVRPTTGGSGLSLTKQADRSLIFTGFAREEKDVMIKNVQPQRPGSADGSVVNPTRQQKMKQTDTRTFQNVDASKTICRPPYSKHLGSVQESCVSGDHNERQGRVSSNLQSRGQARDAILDLVH
jgi:hypothetical protein